MEGKPLGERDGEDFATTAAIDRIIDHYNGERRHSALSFLRPIDFYRGTPAVLLAERRRKLVQARELRKQENLRLRQRLLPRPRNRLLFQPAECLIDD